MRRSRFDIDHGELPSRQVTVHQIGTSYLWIGSTGKLIQILNPGDHGYEENAKIVSAALHPNETTRPTRKSNERIQRNCESRCHLFVSAANRLSDCRNHAVLPPTLLNVRPDCCDFKAW
jgi:hypothetical protein